MLHNETPRLENVEARRAADEAASISRTALAYIVRVKRAHFPEPPPELDTAIATLADDAHAHAPSSRKDRPHD